MLNFPPRRVLLDSSGRAIAAIGVHKIRDDGEDAELVFVARGDGRIVAGLRLRDLFGDRAAAIYSEGKWRRDYPDLTAWIDEAEGLLLVVAEPMPKSLLCRISVVSMKDGAVRRGVPIDIVRSIRVENRTALPAALATARKMGLRVGKQRLIDVFACAAVKTSTRLTAAAMLCELGDNRGKRLISSLADRALRCLEHDRLFDLKVNWLPGLAGLIGDHGTSDDYTAMALSVLYLPNALGKAAVPILVRIAGRSRLALRGLAREAVLRMGADALPALLCVISQSTDRRAQKWARSVIADISVPGGGVTPH